jgi:MFS family permease
VVGAVTFLATEIVAVADLPLIGHFGAGGVGCEILTAAWGAGGLTGALTAARIVSKDNETAAAVLGVLVLGIFAAAVGISPWFALVPLFSLLFAVSDSFAFVGFSGIYQRGTPDAIRGRMSAAVGATTTIASAADYGFAGFLVTAAGWRPVYLAGGLIDIACAALLALTLRIRASRPAQHPPPSRTPAQPDSLTEAGTASSTPRIKRQARSCWKPSRVRPALRPELDYLLASIRGRP